MPGNGHVMNIRHFMTADPVTCAIDDPAQRVAGLLREKAVGAAVVLENGKVAGIVTDRQLCCGPLADGEPDARVSSCMTADPVVAPAETDLFTLLDMFRGAGLVRRIPVVNEEREPIGVVSIADVAVIAERLNRAIMQEMTANLDKVHLQAGGTRMAKKIKNPDQTKEYDPPHLERAVTSPSTR